VSRLQLHSAQTVAQCSSACRFLWMCQVFISAALSIMLKATLA